MPPVLRIGTGRNLAKPGQLLAHGSRNRKTGQSVVQFYRGEGVPEEVLDEFFVLLSRPRHTILSVTGRQPPWEALLPELDKRGFDLATFKFSLYLTAAAPSLPKRIRTIPQLPGMLLARWGRVEYNGPDLCTSWARPASNRDSSFLMSFFSMHAYDDVDVLRGYPNCGYGKRFMDWMSANGFDLRSLKLSVKHSQLAQQRT